MFANQLIAYIRLSLSLSLCLSSLFIYSARYAYETCIFNSARYKCYTNSATFARDTAKMLSDEKHFSNCRQYEQSMCNGSSSLSTSRSHSHWPLWLVVLLWAMNTATAIMMSNRWSRQSPRMMATATY